MKVLKYAVPMAFLGVAMMAVAMAPRTWVQRKGIDVWNLPQLQAEIAENERASAVMDDEARLLTRRIAVKDRLVRDLVQGKTDFAAVTNQFLALNQCDPEVLDHLRDFYHVTDTRELSALNVLAFAETYLDAESLHAAKPSVMIRLDREYDALFPVHAEAK